MRRFSNDEMWPLVEAVQKEYREAGRENRDVNSELLLDLCSQIAEADYPNTLDDCDNWDLIEEVSYRGLEDAFTEDISLSDFDDDEIIDHLNERGIYIPGASALYDSVQNGDSKRTLEIIRSICYNSAGRIVTVNSL